MPSKKKIKKSNEGARPLWTGSLSFGLINIPIYLYSGSKERALNFHLLHKEDYSPVNYKKVCAADGTELSQADIIKGYEIEKNQYVILKESDFKAADARKTSTIDISNFVDVQDIDPVYYDKPYFIEAHKKAEKAYAILREALKKSKKAGIATYVIREREQLGVVRAEGNMLILNQLRHDDELRSSAHLNFPKIEHLSKEEMDVAELLINKLSKPFDIKKYKDTYAYALLKVIKERSRGKTPKPKGEAPKITSQKDLMAMLKRSIAESKAK